MPRKCTICTHPRRSAINEALARHMSTRQVADLFVGLTYSSVHRHSQSCGKGVLEARWQADRAEPFKDDPILEGAVYRKQRVLTIHGEIYLVRAGNGLTKIGLTTKPIRQRITGLQTMSPVPLVVLYVAQVADCRTIERDLHERYAPQRSHGEWFRLTGSDILAIRDTLCQESAQFAVTPK